MKGSPYLYAVYHLRGVEYTESTKCTDEKAARKFLKDKLRKVACDLEGARKFTTPQMAKLRVSDLVADLEKDYQVRGKFSSQTKSHFKRLLRDFGSFKADALTAGEIKEYIAQCQAKGQKNSTINRTTGMLAQAYKLAQIERGFSHVPHVTRLPENNVRMELFSEAQFQAIVSKIAEPVIADLAIFAHAVGSRRGETLQLLWTAKKGDVLKLPPCSTKTNKPRDLAVSTPELRGVLERRWAAHTITVSGVVHTSPWIFSRFNFKKNRFEPIKSFWKQWKGAVRAAGLPAGRGEGWFHTLRKCAVTDGLEAGNDAHTVMEQSGHATDHMLRRYHIITDEAIKKAQERTAAYRATLPKELPASNVIPMKTASK